jgi:predicted nucleic-acid-binding Zn-ribbon protein
MNDDKAKRQCLKCGKSNLEFGFLVSTGTYVGYESVMFRAQNDKIYNKRVAHIYACTCLDCGNVEIYLNPEQLKGKDNE